MKSFLIKLLKLLLIFYLIVCVAIYFFQEQLIFFPQKLSRDFAFDFNQPFREININSEQRYNLHGLLFTTNNPKGLIFYLHGNAGALNSWGGVAERYTELDYDIFILDYAGFGKSEGSINSQEQLYNDLQLAYDEMKKVYNASDIIVLGYSIGTGPAAKLAADNNPRMLILQAPYYSLTAIMQDYYPLLPTFLLKYKFETNVYVKDCQSPIVIFHGDKDEVIDYGNSLKLKDLLKSSDTIITLAGQKHNGITDNPDYISALSKILN